MKLIIKALTPLLFAVAVVGCKKDYLETKPSNAVTEEQIFGKTSDIFAAVDGMYKALYAFGANGNGDHDNFGQKAVDLSMDMMGNDMIMHLQGYNWYTRDYQLTEWTLFDGVNRRPDKVWYYYYDIIKQANKLLSVVDKASGPDTDKKSIRGQALGMRAYGYLYLINIFQQTYKGNESKPGVPLYTEPAVQGKPRGTVADVYAQIIKDLTQAETELNGVAVDPKVKININVVQGLRARAALFQEDWATAATYAAKARTGYNLMSQAQYQEGFSKISNPEWIWGSVIPADQATGYASFWSHMDVESGGYASLGNQKKITKALYDQINAGDVRKTTFRTPGTGAGIRPDYTQTKHREPVAGSWAGDYVYMRAGEMYLIEAEALSRIPGREADARTALETLVKARYPAYSAAAYTGVGLTNEILLQRRIELWGEGWSLFDIKRLKTGLNRPSGPGNHGAPNFDPLYYTLPDGDPKFAMRIPRREMDNNAALTAADQNP